MTRFDALTYPAAGALEEAVLLLPVGSVEPHGPHAPLCTDTAISEALCLRAASSVEDLQVLVLPTIPYGVTRYAAGFPGAVSINEDTLHALITDILTSLVDQGFRHVVVVNNHLEPEHLRTLHRALDDIEAYHGTVVGFLDLTRGYRAQALPEEFRRGQAHAGSYETSILLASWAGAVDEEQMAALPPVEVDMAAAIAAGQRTFTDMGMEQAYCGAPAAATAEEGERTLQTLTDMLVEVIREVAEGRGGRDRPGRGA